MSNALLQSGKQIFGMRKPSKFNVPVGSVEWASLWCWMLDTGRQWATGILRAPQKWSTWRAKCRARAAFRHEMKLLRNETTTQAWNETTLMHVVIIPLLKCKSKDPADINNYRPTAIATALSKLLKQVLLLRLVRYLWTADSQFGFKEEH